MNVLPFFKKQAIAHWIELSLMVFFVAGSLALANYIALRHTVRIDLTPEKRYTLSEQTVQVQAARGMRRCAEFFRRRLTQP